MKHILYRVQSKRIVKTALGFLALQEVLYLETPGSLGSSLELELFVLHLYSTAESQFMTTVRHYYTGSQITAAVKWKTPGYPRFCLRRICMMWQQGTNHPPFSTLEYFTATKLERSYIFAKKDLMFWLAWCELVGTVPLCPGYFTKKNPFTHIWCCSCSFLSPSNSK